MNTSTSPYLQIRDALGCHISGLIAHTANEEDEQAEPTQGADVRLVTQHVQRARACQRDEHADSERDEVVVPNLRRPVLRCLGAGRGGGGGGGGKGGTLGYNVKIRKN